jgi:DNA-binding NarL/FixJ family response regulator
MRRREETETPGEGGQVPMAEPYRIVLVDDYVPFRKHLKDILGEVEGLEIIGEAGDGLELFSILRNLTADLVILDISMPNLGGIEAARRLKTASPEAKVLILTSHKNREYLCEAVSAGVAGYILKNDMGTDLFSAINTIRQGGVYLNVA